MMGPSLIFDKSTLQSLNPDEAMWLDNFYFTNITPLFFVETLADLEKEVKKGKTPEQIVGNIAYKTPDQGHFNAHHRSMMYNELIGHTTIEMSGRPLIPGGQTVMLGNESGVIFQESPEAEAFKRWQKHQFLEVERSIAKNWRKELANTITDEEKNMFKNFLEIFGMPRNFTDLKKQVDNIIDGPHQRESLILGLSIVNISLEAQEKIIKRWEDSGRIPIRQWAPYFVHVVSVDLFFYLGTEANLFSVFPHAQTHKIDIAYLYYLPFCKIFVSNDKIHLGITPFFLRSEQTLVNGLDLKTDLAKLDQHYSNLPEEIKNRGVVTFASIPPDDTSFLVTRLWDNYMSPNWRKFKTKKFDGTDQVDSEAEKKLTEKIKKFAKESKPVHQGLVSSLDNADQVLIKHKILVKKGKWRRFPPEITGSLPF